MRANVPLALTWLRALLAPVMVWLAFHPQPAAFGVCLALAFLSDVFDGIIARRLGVATAALRRLDSICDSIFYVGALYAAWHLYPGELRAHAGAFAVLIGIELLRYAFDWIKFRREAAYHMWSAKLWGICLFAAFSSLLAWGHGGLLIDVALYVGIAADLEGLAISAALRAPRTDVPTLWHALKLQSGSSTL